MRNEREEEGKGEGEGDGEGGRERKGGRETPILTSYYLKVGRRRGRKRI